MFRLNRDHRGRRDHAGVHFRPLRHVAALVSVVDREHAIDPEAGGVGIGFRLGARGLVGSIIADQVRLLGIGDREVPGRRRCSRRHR